MVEQKTSAKTEQKNASNNERSIFTPEKTFRFFIINFITSTLFAMIIWPLLDLLFCFFFKTDFAYSATEHILKPAEFMLFFTIIEFLTWDIWFKDGKKSSKK